MDKKRSKLSGAQSRKKRKEEEEKRAKVIDDFASRKVRRVRF